MPVVIKVGVQQRISYKTMGLTGIQLQFIFSLVASNVVLSVRKAPSAV
jgi:hypothetical protein